MESFDWSVQSPFDFMVRSARNFGRPRPDPWTEGDQEEANAPGAIPLCLHCLSPLDGHRWLCPLCNSSVGPYNNWMEYLMLFSIGDLVRSGVEPTARFTPLTISGYVVIGLLEYQVFAPLYFLRLLLNWRRIARSERQAPGMDQDSAFPPGGETAAEPSAAREDPSPAEPS